MAQKSNWIEVQSATFVKWCNVQLQKADKEATVKDLFEDLKEGATLLNILEGCIGEKFSGKVRRPSKMKIQQLETIGQAFKFMSAHGVKLVNIGPNDVYDGKPKLILGLIWSLISKFTISLALGGDSNNSPKELLLDWINSKLELEGLFAENFKESWEDGKLLKALTNCIGKEIYDDEVLITEEGDSVEATIATAMQVADDKLSVPQLIGPETLCGDVRDEHSVMAYLAQFQTAKKPEPKPDPVEEVITETATMAVAEKEPEPEPTKPAVTKSNSKVPPSQRAADWRAYDGEDLGGRCKIRVFFSTTTSDPLIRKNTQALQTLLESLKVHEREDFEPWIPVDMDMDRDFRNKIFDRAGTRKTPMLFVDDEYIGGYEKVVEMNNNGDLTEILNY